MTETREDAMHFGSRQAGAASGWRYGLAILFALLVLAAGFSRDFGLPGLYMDSINPEYLAVRAVVDEARPDTPALVLPGNLIADRYPVLAGSYYHGPLQYYIALPFYAVLGTDLAAARIVQLAYGVLILLALGLLLMKVRAGAALTATGLALLALDPAFVLALKTQAYNVTWPLAWFFLAVMVVEHWGTRRVPPTTWQSLLAGLLAGVAFFCYFVFLFFLPALAVHLVGQLRAAGIRDWKRTIGVLALHGIGFAVGALPYLWGYQRSATAMGGWDRFIDGHRGKVESLVAQDAPATLAEKFGRSWDSVRMAVDDEWVSRMVLKAPGSELLGDAKVLVLLFGPLVLIAALRALRLRSRLLELCVLSVLCYVVVSTLAFGDRIAPHHFTLLPPLLYAGLIAGLGAAWPRIRAAARGTRLATTAGVALLSLLLVVDSVAGQLAFSARLRQTGGVGFFSEAVTLYAERALEDGRDTAYHFPTWGLLMPFVYLTGGREVTRTWTPTADQLRLAACNGRAVEVAWIPVQGAAAYAEQMGRETGLAASILGFETRDGRPTIAVVRFDARDDAATAPACDGYRPMEYQTSVSDPAFTISLDPGESGCGNEAPSTRASWDLSASGLGGVSIWVDDGAERKLWANTPTIGEATTGPWARRGLRFEITDPHTGDVLATATMGGRPCL